MNDEKYVEIEDSDYNEIIIIEEYKGQISLVLGNLGRDGTAYKKWAFPQTKDKQPAAKALPLKIPLGKDAVKTVEMLLAYLKNTPIAGAEECVPTNDKNDGIPF